MNAYSLSQLATDAAARRDRTVLAAIPLPSSSAAVPCADMVRLPALAETSTGNVVGAQNGEEWESRCPESELRDGLATLASVAGETLLKSRLYFSAECLAQVGPPCARHTQMARDLETLARSASARPVNTPPTPATIAAAHAIAPFLRAICALRTAVRMTQYAAQLSAFLADAPDADACLAPLRDTADAIQRLIFKVATTWDHGNLTNADRQITVRALAEAEAMQTAETATPHPEDAATRMTRAARLCLLVAGEAIVAATQTGDQAAPTTNFCDLYDDLLVQDGEFLLKA